MRNLSRLAVLAVGKMQRDKVSLVYNCKAGYNPSALGRLCELCIVSDLIDWHRRKEFSDRPRTDFGGMLWVL